MEPLEFYNNYYLKTREDGCIIDAFSDGPFPTRSHDGYTLFNDKGTYQLRMFPDGPENEPIFSMMGIPLFRYQDGQVTRRPDAEVKAEEDALPPPPPSEIERLRADVDFALAMVL